MTTRNINVDLKNSLLPTHPDYKEAFLYAHLIKFEKAIKYKKNNGRGAKSYSYITDGSNDILFNDGSTDWLNNANGTQNYVANKITTVGAVSETTQARASNINVEIDATALGTLLEGKYVTFTSNSFTVDVDLVDEGFSEGDEIYFSADTSVSPNLALNTTVTARIDKFTNNNKTAICTPISTGTNFNISSFSVTPGYYNISFSSKEVIGLLNKKGGSSYAGYINREVFIYKAHINPDTGAIIGSPYLLFKGIITSAKITEDPDKKSKISWSISSHWGDFVRVNGRITSDSYHRGLDGNGIPQFDAMKKPSYATDLGFLHSEQAINLIAIYSVMETRTKMKMKRKWYGSKKYKLVEYQVEVDREADLRFNLEAKYLPVVYGVQKIDSIPIFVDTLKNSANVVFVAYAICEGEIGGLYDIYFDDQSSICIDKQDADTRTNQTTENTIDVLCQGRMDRGDTLNNRSNVYDTSVTRLQGLGRGYGTASWRNENWDFEVSPVDGNINLINLNAFSSGQGGTSNTKFGLQHEEATSFEVPIDSKLIFHSGKENQKADGLLSRYALNNDFKIQTDYFNSTSEYWGPNHQLLDTAYVVAQYTINDGETSVPHLDFVVRGKLIDCYNYDNSYVSVPQVGESISNFSIGEEVQIYSSESPSLIETNYIADIFTLPEESNPRIRLLNKPNLNGVTAFYIEKSSNTWHVITHDHIEHSGNVAEALKEEITTSSTAGTSTGVQVDLNAAGLLYNTLNDTGRQPNMALAGIDVTVDPVDFADIAKLLGTISYDADTGGTIDNIGDNTNTSDFDTEVSFVYVTNGVALDTGTSSSTDNYYVGHTIEISRDLGDGSYYTQQREIISYNGTTHVALVNRDWDPSYLPTGGDSSGTPLDTYRILSKKDKRVSINPAIQLLDYLTNDRYGRDLDVSMDIDLDSFRRAARECDSKSDVTVHIANTNSIEVNDIYYAQNLNSSAKVFRGKVKSIKSVTGGKTEVTFTEVIGKLAHKWNDWKTFQENDYVWYNSVLKSVSSTGQITDFNSLTNATITLTKESGAAGSTASISIDTSTSSTEKNPVVKQYNTIGTLVSGYSLYDSDDVKYWKYLGWNSQDQREVTRHQTNTILDTSSSIFDNINSMLNHFNGILRYSNGKYELEVETQESTFEAAEQLTEDDIIGSINVEDAGQKGTFNTVSVGISDPQNRFESRTVSFFDSNYLVEDRNVSKKGDFKTPYVTNYFNARLNARQYLEQSRYGIKISFKMPPKGLLLVAGSLIQITYSRFGWTNKTFRITNLSFTNDCLVQVTAEEHNDSAYLISAIPKQGYISENASTANDPAPLAPTNLTTSTTSKGAINLSWTNSSTYNAANYEVEIYRGTQNSFTGSPAPELIATTKGNTYSDVLITTNQITLYYWIRYAVSTNLAKRTTANTPRQIFSKYYPLSTDPGVSGVTSGSIDGSTITLTPSSVGIAEDPTNLGSYLFDNSPTSVRVKVGTVNIPYDAASPYGEPSFRLGTIQGTNITPGSVSGSGVDYVTLGVMSNLTQQFASIDYEIILVNSLGEEATFTITQTVSVTGVGSRGPGRWNVPVAALPTTSGQADTAWDASWANRPGDPVENDQAWFFTGSESAPTGQNVWIYNGSSWAEQTEVVDGSLLIDSTVGTDQLGSSAVQSGQIANSAVIAGNLASGAVIAGNLGTGAVISGNIGQNAVNGFALASGAVAAENIVAGAITTDKLAASSVTANSIVAGAITTDKLAASSVTATNMTANSIEAIHITSNAVTTDKLAASSVTATNMTADSISAIHISSQAVTTDKLAASSVTATNMTANSIEAIHITSNAVTTDKLDASSVTATNMTANSIEAIHITSNAVTTDKLDAQAITADKIAAGAVFTDKLAANAVTADKLAASSVTADSVVANAITTTKLAACSVTANTIAANAITTDKLAASSVTANSIAANSVTTNAVAANSITSTKIAANSVSAGELLAQSIDTYHLNAEIITANEIAANAITADKIAASSITAEEIAAESITTDRLAANVITTDKLVSSSIIAQKIVSNAIQANHISANSVTADSIVASAISADKIAANAITTNKLAANAVTANTIAANSITSNSIAANSITSDMVTANSVVATLIDASTVTANDITTSSIAALSANLGNITAGTLKGGNIPEASSAPGFGEQGAFLDLSDGKVVFGSQTKYIWFDGTDLNLSGVTIDANSIVNASSKMKVQDSGGSAVEVDDLNFGTNLSVTTAGSSPIIATINALSDSQIRGLFSSVSPINYSSATGGFSLTSLTLSDLSAATVTTSAESFVDNDTTIMTSAAIDDRILSYNYGDISAVTAGTGLIGGGTSGSVTLNVSGLTVSEFAGSSVTTSAESFVDNDTTIMTSAAIDDRILSYNYGDISAVTAGTGLTGGGTSGSVTLNVSGLTVSEFAGSSVTTSAESFVDNDTTIMTSAAIDDRILSYGYTTNTGDITGVTAGSGLTGGGSSGGVTLNIGAGTGITVNADDIALSTAGAGAGTYGNTGDATKIDTITLDAYGRVTAVATGTTGDITRVNITAGDGLSGTQDTTTGDHTQTLTVDSTVVRTSGIQTIAGAKTFSDPVTINANLTVTGTTTSVNSNEVNIGDAIILLNSDETGTPTADAGIEIERGTSTNVKLIYRESGVGDAGSPGNGWTFGSEVVQAGAFYGNFYGDVVGAPTSLTGLTTDQLNEGVTNLYYTTARVNSAIDGRVTTAYVNALNVDADTLDGVDSGSFLRSNAADSWSGTLTWTGGATTALSLGNGNIEGVNVLVINDPGEGIQFTGTNNVYLYAIDDANDNIMNFQGAAQLQVNGTRVLTTADEGSGNGIDADTLDGIQGSSFLRSDANDSYAGILTVNGMNFMNDSNTARNFKMKTNDGSTTDVGISLYTGANAHAVQLYGTSTQYGFLDGNWASWDIRKTKNGNFEVDEGSGLQRVWNAGNDGSGSGLDADLLDGISSGSFLRSDAADTATGAIEISTGTSRPLMLTTSSASPWAIELHRSDLTNSSQVFNSGSSWYFQHNITIAGSTNWHAGNDGSGSGLDADLLDGYSTSTSATANTVAVREGSGHIYGNYILGSYFNASSGNSENPTIGQIWTQNTGDNYLRKSTPAHFISQLSLLTTSGKAADSNLLDGLDLHTGRNNEVNKVVRTDGNGYIQAGWINTTSGSAGTNAPDRIYGSYDGYIRYYSPANLKTVLGYLTTADEGSGNGIDADTVDGIQGASFLRSDTTDTATGSVSLRAGGSHLGNHEFAASSTSTGYGTAAVELRESNYTATGAATPPILGFHWGGIVASTISMDSSGTIEIRNNPGTGFEEIRAAAYYVGSGTGTRALTTADEGSGNGIDADTVDGNHASAFATSGHNHTYNVNDSWLRDNGDNAHVKLYGNSRQMAFRTDGTTEYASGIGGYPFTWQYGGDSSSQRLMLLNTSGQLWLSNYGWLHSAFLGASAKAADSNLLDGLDSTYFAVYDHIRSLGTTAFTTGTTTTAGIVAEAEGDGAFDSYSSVFKTSWSYAGNINITDGGGFTETAGTSFLTWTDNSSDTTRGNITMFVVAPNTGGSAYYTGVYNDQGSGYAPGWREIWNSGTDGSGSGLDADLLDGQQGSFYQNASNINAGTINDAYLPASISSSITGNAATASLASTVTNNANASGAWYDMAWWSGNTLYSATGGQGATVYPAGTYIAANYFNMTHGVATRNSDTIFISSDDNYLRKNNAAGMRTSLSVPTRTGGDASGTWGISITGQASSLSLTSGKIALVSGTGGASFAANHYSIGVDIANNAWSNPNYSDLIIGYHTGIRLGASYSGIRFYNNSPTTDANNDGNGDGGETLLMTVGGAAGTGVSVPNTLAAGNLTLAGNQVMSSGNVTSYAVATTYNTSLNTDSRNSRGVTRLYRRDSDSDYSVQTYWTGSYWRLYGYNGDTGHADTHVGYANTAGNGGVTSVNGQTGAVTVSTGTTYTASNGITLVGNDFRLANTGSLIIDILTVNQINANHIAANSVTAAKLEVSSSASVANSLFLDGPNKRIDIKDASNVLRVRIGQL